MRGLPSLPPPWPAAPAAPAPGPAAPRSPPPLRRRSRRRGRAGPGGAFGGGGGPSRGVPSFPAAARPVGGGGAGGGARPGSSGPEGSRRLRGGCGVGPDGLGGSLCLWGGLCHPREVAVPLGGVPAAPVGTLCFGEEFGEVGSYPHDVTVPFRENWGGPFCPRGRSLSPPWCHCLFRGTWRASLLLPLPGGLLRVPQLPPPLLPPCPRGVTVPRGGFWGGCPHPPTKRVPRPHSQRGQLG